MREEQKPFWDEEKQIWVKPDYSTDRFLNTTRLHKQKNRDNLVIGGIVFITIILVIAVEIILS